jgi:uncharacterized protein involved in exopolysaccharide biosynthesis/Mrp family chromosome partitioning ATPase
MTRSRTAPSISILDVLRGIARRKLLILTCLGLALGAGAALLSVVRPVYTTEAQVLVENLATPFDRPQGETAQNLSVIDDRAVQTEMNVMKSQDLALRVINSLQLANDATFNPLLSKPSKLSALKVRMGFKPNPKAMSMEQGALMAMEDSLTIYQLPMSNVIAIKYSGGTPAQAAAIANATAETYVASTREARYSPTERAREWLAREIESLRTKVAESEAAVEDYRTKAGLIQGQTTTIGAQQLSELNSQITLAQAARTEAEAKAEAIRRELTSKGTVESAPEVTASTMIQRLREQQAAATRRIAELSATYLPNHPKMIGANEDYANLERQIRRESIKIAEGLESQAKVAAAREKSLRDSLEQLKVKESTANVDEIKLKALERDAAANRSLLESLLSRYADASVRTDEDLQPARARIIQRASVPVTPSFPKPGPLMLLLSVAGLALGLGLAFVLEVMRAATALHNAEDLDVRQASAAPLAVPPSGPAVVEPVFHPAAPPPFSSSAAVAPAAAVAPTAAAAVAAAGMAEPHHLNVIARLPDLATLEAARAAADALMHGDSTGLAEGAARITGALLPLHQTYAMARFGLLGIATSDTACAVAALAVARGLAGARQRVILLDLDAEDRAFDEIAGLSQSPGLSDLVSGSADINRIVVRDSQSSAALVSFGTVRHAAAASLVRERLPQTLDTLTAIYDVVLLHIGPARPVTPALAALCQAVVVLAAPSRAREAHAAAAILTGQGVGEVLHVSLSDPA